MPRKFDYHPLAIPAPYNHSNINSDEVIYYVADYPFTWLPSEDHAKEASELAERSPEAFPD